MSKPTTNEVSAQYTWLERDALVELNHARFEFYHWINKVPYDREQCLANLRTAISGLEQLVELVEQHTESI